MLRVALELIADDNLLCITCYLLWLLKAVLRTMLPELFNSYIEVKKYFIFCISNV